MMREKFAAHLLLSRLSNTPTVMTNVFVGVAIAGSFHHIDALLRIVFACVLFYVGGMYLNDVCDFSHDKKKQKHRPLVRGLLTRKEAVLFLTGYFVLGSIILYFVHIRAFLFGLVLLGCIALYNAYHKKNPFSPLLMGACRVLVYLVAFFAFQRQPTIELAIASGLLFLYIIGLTFAAKYEGARKTRWSVTVYALPLLALYFSRANPTTAIIAIGYIIWLLLIHYPNNKGSIRLMIAAISLLDAMLLYAFLGDIGFLLGIIGFVLTLILQNHIRGT